MRSRALLVVGLAGLALACATTKIETQWKDPSLTAQDLAFGCVIAIAQVEDGTLRRVAEDELVRVLSASPRAQARGMQTSPSYPLIEARELADVEAMRRKVEAGGFDGAVVTRLLASQERGPYGPGRYETMWGRVVSYDPGYTTVDQIVRIETSLYSIPEGKRLWSGVTRTLNPSDVPKLVEEVAKAIAKELESQGLLEPAPG